jgi:hypothetical protein
MRFRVGLGVGFATGYVLGTKAGRYRYEQIVKVFNQFWSSPPAERAREQASKFAEQVQEKATEKARAVRDRKISLDDEELAAVGATDQIRPGMGNGPGSGRPPATPGGP